MRNTQILRLVKFFIKAGEASNTPPIGPLLGQFPMDVRIFCNRFNKDTEKFDKGVLLYVFLILYKNGTFEYKIKTPPIFFLLELGSERIWIKRRKKKYGITIVNVYKITLIKNIDYNFLNLRSLFVKILKEAKKSKYKILEFVNLEEYLLYK